MGEAPIAKRRSVERACVAGRGAPKSFVTPGTRSIDSGPARPTGLPTGMPVLLIVLWHILRWFLPTREVARAGHSGGYPGPRKHPAHQHEPDHEESDGNQDVGHGTSYHTFSTALSTIRRQGWKSQALA